MRVREKERERQIESDTEPETETERGFLMYVVLARSLPLLRLDSEVQQQEVDYLTYTFSRWGRRYSEGLTLKSQACVTSHSVVQEALD